MASCPNSLTTCSYVLLADMCIDHCRRVCQQSGSEIFSRMKSWTKTAWHVTQLLVWASVTAPTAIAVDWYTGIGEPRY